MTQNIAAISGTSVSASAAWAPRSTSTPIAANVVTTIAASTQIVDPVLRTRKLYSSAKVIQIRWNGTASQCSKIRIPARPRIHSTIQARSIQPSQDRSRSKSGTRVCRPCQARTLAGAASGRLASGSESVSCTTYRLDQLEPQLGPQPANADVDYIRARIKVNAPHRGQERSLRHRLAGVLYELTQQHDLEPGQRYRADASVSLHAAQVEDQMAGPDHVAGRVLVTKLNPDPGKQFVQRERFGEVILRAGVKASHLRRHVRQAGQHEDRLLRALRPQLPQYLAAVCERHHQIKDHELVVASQR